MTRETTPKADSGAWATITSHDLKPHPGDHVYDSGRFSFFMPRQYVKKPEGLPIIEASTGWSDMLDDLRDPIAHEEDLQAISETLNQLDVDDPEHFYKLELLARELMAAMNRLEHDLTKYGYVCESIKQSWLTHRIAPLKRTLSKKHSEGRAEAIGRRAQRDQDQYGSHLAAIDEEAIKFDTFTAKARNYLDELVEARNTFQRNVLAYRKAKAPHPEDPRAQLEGVLNEIRDKSMLMRHMRRNADHTTNSDQYKALLIGEINRCASDLDELELVRQKLEPDANRLEEYTKELEGITGESYHELLDVIGEGLFLLPESSSRKAIKLNTMNLSWGKAQKAGTEVDSEEFIEAADVLITAVLEAIMTTQGMSRAHNLRAVDSSREVTEAMGRNIDIVAETIETEYREVHDGLNKLETAVTEVLGTLLEVIARQKVTLAELSVLLNPVVNRAGEAKSILDRQAGLLEIARKQLARTEQSALVDTQRAAEQKQLADAVSAEVASGLIKDIATQQKEITEQLADANSPDNHYPDADNDDSLDDSLSLDGLSMAWAATGVANALARNIASKIGEVRARLNSERIEEDKNAEAKSAQEYEDALRVAANYTEELFSTVKNTLQVLKTEGTAQISTELLGLIRQQIEEFQQPVEVPEPDTYNIAIEPGERIAITQATDSPLGLSVTTTNQRPDWAGEQVATIRRPKLNMN